MECNPSVSVYYLASGRLGVPILDALVSDQRLRFLGVGTQPDRPRGRRRRVEPTPVGGHADAAGIGADRVPSVNDEGFLARLRELAPDVVVVASFGQILKPALLSLPRYGCLNIHASLLPRHRGAAPISAAILSGDRQTGVTFMQMDAGLDTGPVYRSLPLDIHPTETTEELEARLGRLAADAVGDCILAVARGELVPYPQPSDGATYAPRLTKEDGRIDWSRSAGAIERLVRAMAPWPCAYTDVPAADGPRRLQLLAAAVETGPPHSALPGVVLSASPAQGLVVACGEGSLRLRRVRPAGKGDMAAEEFLKGHALPVGSRLDAATMELEEQ